MRTFTFAFSTVLLAAAAHSQTTDVRQFTFEGVPLGAKLAQLSQEHRKDCEASKDGRFSFCDLVSVVGEVRLQATLSFDRDELSEIQVYFPTKHFDLVWSALRAKYGMEDSRSPERLEWYSNHMRPDQPIPDELVLFRVAQEQPVPDGKRIFSGISYAMLQYRSLHVARADMQRRSKEREQKVQDLKGKL